LRLRARPSISDLLLIYEHPAFPEVEYTFKHVLTQEVSYNSVLMERRRALHGRTAQAIEGLYGDRLEEHYSDLAHHYSRSGSVEKAVDFQSLESGVRNEAEGCIRRAIDIARRQSAKSLELRAVTSLSRLWQQQGKKAEARQMLGEIYGWFTEGFDTANLKRRKTFDLFGTRIALGLAFLNVRPANTHL